MAGLVGGGPTFAGSVLGYTVVSPVLSILFLGLAAGALIFVFNEMMGVARRFSLPMVTGVALTIGLLAAFGTDFILTAAGSSEPPRFGSGRVPAGGRVPAAGSPTTPARRPLAEPPRCCRSRATSPPVVLDRGTIQIQQAGRIRTRPLAR